MARGNQALDDVGAVQPFQGHDVADRRQRHDIQPGKQIERAGTRIARLAQEPQGRHEHEKDDAGRAEMPLPRKIVLPVRVYQRVTGRQLVGDLVMIDDDDVGVALPCGGERLETRRSAIDRDDQAGALLDQLLDCRWIRPVALENPVRNIDAGANPEMAEEAIHKRGGRRAIHVVVAEDGNAFALADSLEQALGRLFAIGQQIGIRHQAADRGIEECGGLIERNAATGKHARDQIGQSVGLGDRKRAVLPCLVEPRYPAIARCRLLDAQKCPLYRIRRFHHSPHVLPPLPITAARRKKWRI